MVRQQLPQDVTVVIVPGLHDSGPSHWQSLWAWQLPRVCRVVQADWFSPRRQPWVEQVAAAVNTATDRVLVAAHSLGCLATVHLPSDVAQRIAGALLVAPADPERRALLHDFAPVPCDALPYLSIVVSSRNDPWCTARLAANYAKAWGSDFVLLQEAGHVNVEAGYGAWPLGLGLLAGLAQETIGSDQRLAARA